MLLPTVIHRILFGSALACVLALLTHPAFADPTYTVTDLGFDGYDCTIGGIGARGQVFGNVYVSSTGETQAFVDTNGSIETLGSLGGQYTMARGFNSNDQVVGYSDINNTTYHAFLYDQGTMRDLGTLGGENSAAVGINSSGEVVGEAATAHDPHSNDLYFHAFLYSHDAMTDIGTLGGNSSDAAAINDSGQIVGSATIVGDTVTHAFLYSHGVMTDIGTLGGSTSGALAIDSSGQIAGDSEIAGDVGSHTFLYSDGKMNDLGTLGGSYATTFAMNDSGQIVGGSAYQPGGSDLHAFLATLGGMKDLNTMIDPNSGWTLQSGQGINDAGQIVGHGYIGGQYRVFLLTPNAVTVAEPATLALFPLLGVTLLLCTRRCVAQLCGKLVLVESP